MATTLQNGVAVRHFRVFTNNGTPSSRGGATVAYQPRGEGQVHFALAFCNAADNFSRKRGRDIATGRLDTAAATCQCFNGSIEGFESRLDMVTDSWSMLTCTLAETLSEAIEADIPAAHIKTLEQYSETEF
jgi:hypothetical protein